jgi:hypothetical protein
MAAGGAAAVTLVSASSLKLKEATTLPRLFLNKNEYTLV